MEKQKKVKVLSTTTLLSDEKEFEKEVEIVQNEIEKEIESEKKKKDEEKNNKDEILKQISDLLVEIKLNSDKQKQRNAPVNELSRQNKDRAERIEILIIKLLEK